MHNDPQTFHIGMDGFVWFVGIVESTEDSLMVGRAAVRILGWHDADKDKLSTAELPWAYPVMPITTGRTPPNYRVGDWVVGFFLDGKLGQQPMIFGVLPAVPTPESLATDAIKSAAKSALATQLGPLAGLFL